MKVDYAAEAETEFVGLAKERKQFPEKSEYRIR
jgi:hypothetical protein